VSKESVAYTSIPGFETIEAGFTATELLI